MDTNDTRVPNIPGIDELSENELLKVNGGAQSNQRGASGQNLQIGHDFDGDEDGNF